MLFTCLNQFLVQVCAVHDRIGIAKTGPKVFIQWNPVNLFGGDRVHKAQMLDVNCLFARALADAEIIERMEGIRSELDTRTDFSKLGGFFKHDNILALFGKTERRAQPAKSTTGNDNLILCHGISSLFAKLIISIMRIILIISSLKTGGDLTCKNAHRATMVPNRIPGRSSNAWIRDHHTGHKGRHSGIIAVDQGTCPEIRHQSQDRREVEIPAVHRRPSDGPGRCAT